MMRQARPVVIGVFTIALGAVVAAVGVSAALSPQSATIEALVVPERVDLGEAVRGGLVEFSFDIANSDAKSPLRIERLSTSCGCTTLDVEESLTISPGASRQIKGLLRLTALGHGDDYTAFVYFGTSPGEVQRVQLYVEFADPLPRTATIGADGVVAMMFDPRYLALLNDLTVYPRNSDTALPSEIDDEHLLRVSVPASLRDGLDGLDVVIVASDGAGGGTYRVVHEVAVSR